MQIREPETFHASSNEWSPRVSENTLTQSFENLRDPIKRSSLSGTINQFKKQFQKIEKNLVVKNQESSSIRSSTPNDLLATSFNDDKLVETLGLFSSSVDEFQSNNDLQEIRPKRKTKNLVHYLGGPDLIIDGNVKTMTMKTNTATYAGPPNEPSDCEGELRNDLQSIRSLPINQIDPVQLHDRLQVELVDPHTGPAKIGTDSDPNEIPISKTKDLSKYFGAPKNSIEAPVASRPESKLNPLRRLSKLKKSLNRKAPIQELMNDPSPEVRNAIQLVQFHLDNPPQDHPGTGQPILTDTNLQISRENIHSIASRAKEKLKNTVKLILKSKKIISPKSTKPTEILKLQSETIHYLSVNELLEEFKRESKHQLKKPSFPTINVKGSTTEMQKEFFNESMNYRIIDLIRLPPARWATLLENSEIDNSIETLHETENYEEFSPLFIYEMLKSSKPTYRKPISDRRKQIRYNLSKECLKSASKVDITAILQKLLGDSQFRREIFHDRLWELPNKEAYPELFGHVSEPELLSPTPSTENSNESTTEFIKIHLEETKMPGLETEGKEKIHPLETLSERTTKHRRWVTQFSEQKPNCLKTSKSIHNGFGFAQLERLNQVIEEETRGVEQLRRLNAVLSQEPFVKETGISKATTKTTDFWIPSFETFKSFVASRKPAVISSSFPSFTSILETPKENNKPDLVKYMFKAPHREIFVNGVGAEEMISPRKVDDTSIIDDQKSIISVSELLSDAI
jgi:hypothetical protein